MGRSGILITVSVLLISASGCDSKNQCVGCGTTTETLPLTANPSPTPSPTSSPTPPLEAYITDSQVLASFPSGAAQLAVVCSRTSGDIVHQKFCVPSPPRIQSLSDLENTLGLGFNGSVLPQFAIQAGSSSLLAMEVSAINPRAIIFSVPTPDFVALSFVRGEEYVEIAAGEPSTGSVNFYLVNFTKTCDGSSTCTNADYLTPAVESGWTGTSIYGDEDLKNTILDCRQCHQPQASGKKFLRMQEFTLPWTHWMENNLVGGKALQADYHAAHGTNEVYAGIPANIFDQADPNALQAMITLLGQDVDQTNQFDGTDIEAQVTASSPAQPANNAVPGTSTTWNGIFASFVAGTSIEVPYHDVKVTDPTELASATSSYVSYMAGNLPASQLPDIRQVFPTNATQLADMGFRAVPGESPQQILINTCAQCHNSNLDQTLTRAKYNVFSSTTSATELVQAIKRIQAPADDLSLMPPRKFRSLTAAEISSIVDYLAQQAASR